MPNVPHLASPYVYVIWSFEHQAWWRPGAMGYTGNLEHAGRFDAREAGDIVTNSILAEEVAIESRLAELNGAPTIKSLWQ